MSTPTVNRRLISFSESLTDWEVEYEKIAADGSVFSRYSESLTKGEDRYFLTHFEVDPHTHEVGDGVVKFITPLSAVCWLNEWNRPAPPDLLDLIPADQNDSKSRKSSSVSSRSANIRNRRTPQIVRRNDARDKWLYSKCCKKVRGGALLTYREVAEKLMAIADTRGWNPIEDYTSIKNAANRWAERNGKPPIPKRQAGRKPK